MEAAKGTVVPFAKGGLIKQPTIFPFADGIGLAGEKGTEAIMPLMRDRSGRLGVSAQGTGGNVTIENHVTVINNSDAEVSTERRTNAAGQEELIIKIDRALGALAGRGEGQLFKILQSNFGGSVQPVSR